MPRFLVTDDDEVTHAYLRHVLLGLGEVTHVFSGQEALEAFEDAMRNGHPYDCVLMDVLMPGLTGLETMARIRETCLRSSSPEPRFVLTTCLSQGECRRQAPEACRADAFVAKPFDRADVLTALAGLGFGQPPGPERGEDFW